MVVGGVESKFSVQLSPKLNNIEIKTEIRIFWISILRARMEFFKAQCQDDCSPRLITERRIFLVLISRTWSILKFSKYQWKDWDLDWKHLSLKTHDEATKMSSKFVSRLKFRENWVSPVNLRMSRMRQIRTKNILVVKSRLVETGQNMLRPKHSCDSCWFLLHTEALKR